MSIELSIALKMEFFLVVGRNIHNILDDKLLRVQQAMENELKAITLAEVLQDADKYLANK